MARTDIADLLDNLRAGMMECLSEEDATILGPPTDSFTYVGPPPADCCDALAVWTDKIANYSVFPVEETIPDCRKAARMARVHVRLYRACWPVVQDDANNPFPSAESMQAASDAIHVDLNVMWCCAENGFSGQTGGCDSVAMVSGIYGKPRGGCVWSEITAWVELDACCR